ncbi:MAG: hypothetical protein KatS3mg009_1192 [Acidimicrobiia bacterium]|nr:MAG: hypothetical protein KatS3mg009_1192 [Acidimicrobiia bacterium]
MAVLVAVETVVIVLLTVLVAGLLRSHAEILRRLHELGAGLDPDAPAGERERPVALRPRGDLAPGAGASGPAHDVVGVGLRDDAVHIPVVGVRHRTLLAFLSSGCLTCRGFWDTFASGADLGLPDDIRLVVVTKDLAEESPSALAELAPADLPVACSSATWAAYGVPGSPYFVLADGATGQVQGEGTGVSWEQVRGLVLQATGDAAVDLRNEARIDRELLASGIRPGDPSLYRTAEQIEAEHRP